MELSLDTKTGLFIYALAVGINLIIDPDSFNDELHDTNNQLYKPIKFLTSYFFTFQYGQQILGLIHILMAISVLRQKYLYQIGFSAIYILLLLSLTLSNITESQTSAHFVTQKQSEGLQRLAIHFIVASMLLKNLSSIDYPNFFKKNDTIQNVEQPKSPNTNNKTTEQKNKIKNKKQQ